MSTRGGRWGGQLALGKGLVGSKANMFPLKPPDAPALLRGPAGGRLAARAAAGPQATEHPVEFVAAEEEGCGAAVGTMVGVVVEVALFQQAGDLRRGSRSPALTAALQAIVWRRWSSRSRISGSLPAVSRVSSVWRSIS